MSLPHSSCRSSPTKVEHLLESNATTMSSSVDHRNPKEDGFFLEQNLQRYRHHRHHPVPIEDQEDSDDPAAAPSLDVHQQHQQTHCCFHCCFPSFPPPVEANGLALDMYARATVAMCSLFLGPALLDLANDAAGCTEENPEYSSSSSSMCDNTIYGFRPSSLLTNLATISGLLSSFALPLFGSIVDHTPYRRHVGAYTAAGLVLVKTIEGVILGPSTWFVVTGLQIASALLYQLHITASYAYLSELSTDSHVQAEYNTTFSIILYISTLLFMIQVMGISMGWNVQEDDVSVARIALLISAGTCTLLLAPAWTCFFRDRPAKKCTNSTSSSSVSLCTAGFHQVLITSQQIRNQYPAIRSLLGAIACSEAASGALISVSTTYMKHNLGMNANEIGAVFFVVLLCGIPGSKLGGYLSKRLGNPVRSVIVCNLTFIFTTTLAAHFLRGPEDKQLTWVFGGMWGMSLAWLPPQHTAAFVPIIPRHNHQETELMGIYLLAGQILSWLPPTLFTILNEMGVPMSYGLVSLNIFFLLGIVHLWSIGDYNEAINAVHRQVSAQEEDNNHDEGGEALELRNRENNLNSSKLFPPPSNNTIVDHEFI